MDKFVVSLNAGFTKNAYEPDSLIDLVQEFDNDVSCIALQEVSSKKRTTETVNLLNKYADEREWKCLFQQVGTIKQEHVVMLFDSSRFDALSVFSPENAHNRWVGLELKSIDDGSFFTPVVAHCSYKKVYSYRTAERNELHHFCKYLNNPCILADFNCEPSRVIKDLKIEDSLRVALPDGSGTTGRRNSNNPIDNIIVPAGYKAVDAEIMEVKGTDHKAVICRMEDRF